MKKSLLFLIFSISVSTAYSQIGINTETPQATLDVVGDNTTQATGIIAPRQTRQQLITKGTSYTVNQRGAIVYVTDITGSSPATANITQVGYYYFDGALWQPFSSASSGSATNWSLTGNTTTTRSTNFLGTTDAVDLVLKTSATERMTIAAGGNVGIGATVPTNKLHVTAASNPVKFEGLVATANPATDRVVVVGTDGVLKTSSPISTNYWGLTGNGGTSRSTNYIGTSDANDLVVRTNATERMTVTAAGNIGVGTTAPTTKLHVSSAGSPAVRIVDGTQGDGRVFTSDANGNGSWQTKGPQTTQGVVPQGADRVYSSTASLHYIEYSVLVPPGRSTVTAGIIVIPPGLGYATFRLSTSSSTFSQPAGVVPNYSGFTVVNAKSTGQVMWYANNTTGSSQTYYVWMVLDGGANVSGQNVTVGGTNLYGEPFIMVAF